MVAEDHIDALPMTSQQARRILDERRCDDEQEIEWWFAGNEPAVGLLMRHLDISDEDKISLKEVKRRWRRWMLGNHPDKGGSNKQ